MALLEQLSKYVVEKDKDFLKEALKITSINEFTLTPVALLHK